MLIVDASCLFEVVAGTPQGGAVRGRTEADPDQAAPHLIDAEVAGAVRLKHLQGVLDRTAATQAIGHLRAWPGERFGHRPLLERAWELRHNVRSGDAFYVALAESLEATLLTRDRRLAAANGPRCTIEVVNP